MIDKILIWICIASLFSLLIVASAGNFGNTKITHCFRCESWDGPFVIIWRGWDNELHLTPQYFNTQIEAETHGREIYPFEWAVYPVNW